MSERDRSPAGATPGRLLAIAALGGAFAYTAGWLTPGRLTPPKIVDTLAPPTGAAPGSSETRGGGGTALRPRG